MSVEIPTTEPLSVYAGDTWKWRREDLASDYPASAWTLTYYLTRAASKVTIVATADGDNFVVTVAKATTAAIAAGSYFWAAFASSATERAKIDSGTIEVLPDLAASAALDRRTHGQKVLDAIEAVIEGRATVDQVGYTIGGRRLDKTPIADLLMLRGHYKDEVAGEQIAERIANGLGNPRRILARFS
jgi:hypothetical protein